MKRTFVRTKYFEKRWDALDLTEEDFRELETMLLQDPQAGDVVPHSGGLRKMRVPLQGRGKRGGARVLYVDICSVERTYLLDIYAKNDQENMTADQLKAIRELIKSGGLL